MAPKTNRDILLKARLDFETNNFKSIAELSLKYGINQKTLAGRIAREGWKEKREVLSSKIEQKVKERVLSRAESYLSSLQSRVEKYEKIIDVSLENLGSKTSEGIPILDPEAIDQYTRSEGRLKDIGLSAHRIPTMSNVDVKSGGMSLGESIASAIEKLRADPSKIVEISPEQIEMLSHAEVEP